MHDATLIYLLKGDQVYLAMKKRGFGEGKLNGYGGKVKPDERLTQAAARELEEESGVSATEEALQKIGEITFHFPHKPEWDQVVHVFFIESWDGEPVETEEMKPFLFNKSELPYDKMWIDDEHWLPHAIAGKHVKGKFVFTEDQQIKEHDLHHAEPGEIEWN